MEKYLYLLLSLYTLAWWLIMYWKRPDLRRALWRTSIAGALAGPVAEVWYFPDYWQPLTLIGPGKIFIEDFIVGFGIVGMSVGIYDLFFRMKNENGFPSRKKEFLLMFLVGVVVMVGGNNVIGWNSVIVSEAAFLLFAAWILIRRPDLLKASLMTGALLTIIMFPIYVILFSWISPHYWDDIWLLAGTSLGKEILHIPLTELIWYFTWGCFGGIAYNFVKGTRKISA